MSKQLVFGAFLAVFCSAVYAQGVYKCGNNYSQTPCGPAAVIIQKPPPLASEVILKDEATEQQKADSEKLCRAAVIGRLKDPESARFNAVSRGNVVERQFPEGYGQRRKLVTYNGYINARNGYGGYTGDRLFFCFLNFEETRVLDVDILGR